MKEIHPDVLESVGRWVLEKYSVYNPYSGVTNNQSESMNRQVILPIFKTINKVPIILYRPC